MFVFVHGSGRGEAHAWPTVDRDDAVFADISVTRDVIEQAAVISRDTPEDSVLVAHSHGAVATALALAELRPRIRGVLLLEPGLYDIARGNPAVETHIAEVTAARDALASHGVAAFWRAIRPVMFGGPFDESLWPQESERATRFAEATPPWGFGIRPDAFAGLPTVVVTGGWNDEYEAIAAVLVDHGAEHRVFEDAHHRPQDDSRFPGLLASFRR